MTTQKFNIFKVLEKDDKELIHSSFICFLLTENDILLKSFFKIDNLKFSNPVLEKSYTIPNNNRIKGEKADRKRIDVEATSIDRKQILVIENKFKSFPNEQQLISYDNIYNIHHKEKKKHKFLLCFDKELVSFNTDWKVIDYSELLTFIKENFFKNANKEKLLFIRHYYIFLENYYKKYEKLKIDSKSLFETPKDIENKFWLKLVYSALHLELFKYFKSQSIIIRFNLNPGNTSIPLLNIIPEKWNINGKELLIQFQGNDLKFYSHSNDRSFIEKILNIAKLKFANEEVEMKKMTRRDAKTYFIFKTKLTKRISTTDKFSLNRIKDAVIEFYKDIDEKVVNNFSCHQ